MESPPLDNQTLSSLRDKVRGYLVGGLLTDESFKRMYQDPHLQAGMLVFNGVPGEMAGQAYSRARGISDKCLCPRSGHDEEHPSADVVFYKRHRVLKVRCHHGNHKPTGLPDLYAMRTTGVYHDLTKAELKLWTLRMLVDMGTLDPAEVERRPLSDDLPDDAPGGLRETYYAIIQVLGLCYLFGKSPSPLVRGFLARWSGLTEGVIGHCLQWLLKHWYLKGGVFLRPDGTFSETREMKMSPECFVPRLDVPKPRGSKGPHVKRTRKEWAEYRERLREEEALYWAEYEAAERNGEFDDLDWNPDDWDREATPEEVAELFDVPFDEEDFLELEEALRTEVSDEIEGI